MEVQKQARSTFTIVAYFCYIKATQCFHLFASKTRLDIFSVPSALAERIPPSFTVWAGHL